ncbi:hypothetical protein [Neomegalonema sp.]|uniref:hypothetical protein n=1 Tax=Neomegalonema sp. TaxID=2039713 RepID=UPI0026032EBE|nr:hypothetical protein [Neomegalonema sp.]MDD2869831.1 hypothetical protein [Neomegalonema sp.]
MAEEARRRSGRKRKPQGFGAGVLAAAALGALALGAGGMWLIAGGGAKSASAARGDAAGVFSASAVRHFPEAYAEFSRISFERQASGELWPVEARFFVPAARFAADLADSALSGAADIRSLESTFATAPPLGAQEMRRRLEALAGEFSGPDRPRCQDYTIGRERNLPWPNWPDPRVRELVVEFNTAC